MLEQLYFPGFQSAVAGTCRRERLRVVVGQMSAEKFCTALTMALACENVAFTTYSLMVRAAGGPTVVEMVDSLNLSYHAIVHQVERAPYFRWDRSGRRVRVFLSPEGEMKAARIAKRLNRQPWS